MLDLQIQGTSTIMGVEVPNVIGGFGEGQKSITDKSAGEIHNMKPIHIREKINDNRKRFKDGIDIIDLKGIGDTDTLIKLGYSKQSITQAKNIYLLSERGYSKLIKIMDTDLAWDIHDEMMDNYFSMKQIIQENPIERAMKKAIAEGTSQETLSELADEIAKKTIEEVTPTLIAEGVNKGIKQGYGQGYTQAELEGKAKLKKELNGQDRGYTYSQLCTTINEQYHGRVKIIASFITDYLLEEGYFEKEIFPAQVNGKIKYKNGQIVKENKATKQPTYKFIAEVVNTGCATTKEDFRGKIEVKLLDRFEDWFFDNHFTKFIDYIEKTHK